MCIFGFWILDLGGGGAQSIRVDPSRAAGRVVRSFSHRGHSRGSASGALKDAGRSKALQLEERPFGQGAGSTMGLFKKKVEETGDKKDLKANYTTEDHKTELNALLGALNTHATQVGWFLLPAQ